MKINQVPEIYFEQYLLNELPENLRKEMDDLILRHPEINYKLNEIKKSNEEILSSYPSGPMADSIMDKKRRNADTGKLSSEKKSSPSRLMKNITVNFRSLSAWRYARPLAAAAVMFLVILVMIPGIRNTYDVATTDDNVRIKGLDSKLLLYRMKGNEVDELKNFSAVRKGDIIQAGYIASGNYRYGAIISIDGRGSVTMHLPQKGNSGRELVMNKKILLGNSYELDDSPSFERFIMILSPDPIDSTGLIEKAKKLAIRNESARNGTINTGKGSIELSIILNKIE